MAIRKVFIQHREFVPVVAHILGRNVIDIEYEFSKAEILNEVCVFETEVTPAQAREIDRQAKLFRDRPKPAQVTPTVEMQKAGSIPVPPMVKDSDDGSE